MASSAVIIEVPDAEPAVGAWRRQFDPIARLGIPAHITVLYPFHAPAQLDAVRRDRIGEIAAATDAFDFELTDLNEFPGVLWLRPVPAGQFIALTRALSLAFPECPPYEGRHKEARPHLTLVHPDALGARAFDDVRAEVEWDLARKLPIATRATSLSVFGTDDDEEWRHVATFPLRGA